MKWLQSLGPDDNPLEIMKRWKKNHFAINDRARPSRCSSCKHASSETTDYGMLLACLSFGLSDFFKVYNCIAYAKSINLCECILLSDIYLQHTADEKSWLRNNTRIYEKLACVEYNFF